MHTTPTESSPRRSVAQADPSTPRPGNGIGRLLRTEAKLFTREPVSLIFVVAFPALTVLILGGVFDPNDPGFGGAKPSDYYVAAYFGVVLAAVGLIMLPVHLASYRERGVLRRFQASHFPPWSLPAAWLGVGALMSVVGFASLVLTAAVSYGLPSIQDLPGTAAAIVLATFTYLSIGLLLGLLLPTARSAQGVGLALFFPSFLLGGGGPPPDAMPGVMRTMSNVLPTTQAVRAVQHSWIGIGSSATPRLMALAAIGVAATIGWIRLAGRSART